MKMLGGSYGEGTITLMKYSQEFDIIPKSSWSLKSQRLSLSDITHFEDIDSSSSGTLGKAGIGAAAGFLLAGPLAGLAGMAIGASGGSSTKFVFAIGFSNGDAIMIGASAKEYMAVKSIINLEPPKTQIKASAVVPKQSRGKQATKKNAKFAIIDGRAKKTAPEPNGELVEEIEKLFNDFPNGSDEKGFFKVAQKYKKALNDFKWRYFDLLLTNDEAVRCIQMVVIYAHDQQNSWKRTVERHQEFVEDTLTSSIEMYEEESKKFFGSAIGSKSYLAERLKETKETKAEYLDQYIPDAKKSAQMWAKRVPVFEKIGATLIGEEAVEQGKKTYLTKFGLEVLKSDDSLMLNFGKKFFKDVQFEVAGSNADDSPQIQAKHANSDVEARLGKLSSLLEKKLITKAEFNQKKKSILDEI